MNGVSLVPVKSIVLAAVAIAAVGAPLAHAQYTGPSEHKAPKTVSEILKSGVDDQDVTLTGTLLRKVSNDKYIFSDGTGEIRVEIDAEDFPNAPVSDKSKVTLRGEIEKDFMRSVEIDVDAISLAS